MDKQTQPNPYLVLGVDFGASTTAANAAFGRATRRLRKQADAPYSLHDLTAALSRIEEAQRSGDHDELAESFQVPADPEVYEVQPSEGLLLLPVQVQQRKTAALSAESIDELRNEVIDDALDVMADDLDTHSGVYGLGIDLGAPVSLDRSPTSMGAVVADIRATAFAQLERDVAGSTDPVELQEWGEQALGANVWLPESLAVAFLENRHTPAPILVQVVSQMTTTPAVLRTLAADPETPPDVLQELSRVDDRDIRIKVARNPATSNETREDLATNENPEVRKAATKYQRRHDPRRRKLYWIAGITLIVLVVGIVAAVLLGSSTSQVLPSEATTTESVGDATGETQLVMSGAEIESKISSFSNESYEEENLDVTVTVSCPDEVPVEKGGQFECSMEDGEGRSLTVYVTQTSDQGAITWDFES